MVFLQFSCASKEYLAKMYNLHKHHGAGTPEVWGPWAQFGGGNGGRVPPTSSDAEDIICHVPPHFFLFRFCIWWGLKNISDVCHSLCDELFVLDGRPHIAMLMMKQKFGVV